MKTTSAYQVLGKYDIPRLRTPFGPRVITSLEERRPGLHTRLVEGPPITRVASGRVPKKGNTNAPILDRPDRPSGRRYREIRNPNRLQLLEMDQRWEGLYTGGSGLRKPFAQLDDHPSMTA